MPVDQWFTDTITFPTLNTPVGFYDGSGADDPLLGGLYVVRVFLDDMVGDEELQLHWFFDGVGELVPETIQLPLDGGAVVYDFGPIVGDDFGAVTISFEILSGTTGGDLTAVIDRIHDGQT